MKEPVEFTVYTRSAERWPSEKVSLDADEIEGVEGIRQMFGESQNEGTRIYLKSGRSIEVMESRETVMELLKNSQKRQLLNG